MINGDAGLHIPDFRAAEKTFQLMTQVAGRSGRGVVKGEVIIQTYCMENSTIRCAAEQDYLKFFKEEMEIRKVFCYPPFSHLVKLTFAGKKEEKVVEASQAARELLIKNLPAYFEFLPVVPCGYAKVKELYRFQFLCKSPSLASPTQLQSVLVRSLYSGYTSSSKIVLALSPFEVLCTPRNQQLGAVSGTDLSSALQNTP